MTKRITTAFLATLFALLATASIAAPIAFQVDTMSQERSMNPGDSQTGVITVTNVAQPGPSGAPADPIRLRVYAMDWTLDRKGNPQFDAAGSATDSCSNWLQISPVEVEVLAGQSSQVRYTITAPASAQGCYHCMIMFETTPAPAATGQRTMVVSGRIGSALYVTVGPQVKRLRVLAFSSTPTDTLLTLENTGNSYVRLKGALEFRDSTDKVVQQVPLPGAVVLSGSNNQRDFDIKTPKLQSGDYTATVIVDYGGPVLIGARTHVSVP